MKTYKEPVMTKKEIYADMCGRIENLELKPGEPISENDISSSYNVSRSITRGVFAKLKERRLIEVFPQRGTYVSFIDINYIKDVQYCRYALECEILRDVLVRKDKSCLIAQLEENLNLQRQYMDSVQYEDEFGKLDSKFHRSFARFVDREGAFRIIGDYNIHVRRWRNLEVATVQKMRQLVEEHQEIYELIVRGNTGSERKLKEILTSHLNTLSDVEEEIIERYREYFYIV